MSDSRPPLLLTNTLGRRLEEFQPIEPGRARVYTCGPTVYNYQHIGNFRTFIFADTLRRVLRYNGLEVTHVRNITDVGHLTRDDVDAGEDKMELAMQREQKTVEEIAKYYTDIFLRDAERLNVEPMEYMPRATRFIPSMIALVERLLEEGKAYVADGSVYFDVSSFPRYGCLSGNSVDDLIAGARVEVDEHKRSPADFALWKSAGPEKLMRFESPWGMGVPGWHLECSAMAIELLGEQIDIHTGGIDHIFPHHEDEIAQSEGATGRRFAQIWMHSAFLELAGEEKMSKSLGNFYTVSDLDNRGIHPLALRYFVFQAHYRTPLSFSWPALEAAHTALTRAWETAAALRQSAEPGEITGDGESFRRRFHTAVNHDLDLPVALSVLHDVLSSKLPAAEKLALLADFDRVLGLDLVSTAERLSSTSVEEETLLAERAAARARRDWTLSDDLRRRLAAGGLEVKDTSAGQRWVRTDVLPSRDVQ
jgi:cysteinyl-tRNA synthetase